MVSIDLQDIHEAQNYLSNLRWEYWREEIIFSFQWFFLLFVLFIVLIVWIKTLQRKNLQSTLLVGSFTLIVTTFLDTLGGELQLWEYPYMILPWGPRILCIDIIIAVIFMMNYQFFHKWKSYIFSSTIISAVFSFVLEPLSVLLNLYEPMKWNSFYSFPIYILISLIIKWIVEKIKSIAR